jgi:glycosyltransferase involved in cell wall biosynthesis
MWILLSIGLVGCVEAHLFETNHPEKAKPSWGVNLEENTISRSHDPYFFVVIPTYNNEELCIANIESVLKQTYVEWRLCIIDDCSSDKTFEILTNYVAGLDEQYQQKIMLMRNTHRRKALYNLWFAITHYCRPEWIVVTLDGDDELAHEHVLDRLIQEYQHDHVWATHGQYINYPRGTMGGNAKVPDVIAYHNRFREYHWVTTHLRTFKAWLFHQIKLEDLMIQGECYPMAWDLALMFPILEQASQQALDGLPHFRFIPDVLYIYKETLINDWKVDYALIAKLDKIIRSQSRYQPVKAPVIIDAPALKTAKADLVVFSFDRPLQLEALLRSTKEFITGLDKKTVIYRTTNEAYERGYEQLKHEFPDVIFVRQSRTHPHDDFKPLTTTIVFDSPSQHILFAVDDIIVKDYVDISECILALEKTHAYGFYLRLGTHVNECYMTRTHQGVPPLLPVAEGIYAWQFGTGAYDWRYPNTVDMTLYRKEDIKGVFAAMCFRTPNSLEGTWASGHCPALRRVGLTYEQSKMINIPLNQVQTDFLGNRNMACITPAQLLEKFNQGLRMDFRSLIGMKNRSAHMEWIPQFYSSRN